MLRHIARGERMHPLDGIWLKVKRAQKHMVDINREAIRYASGNPYEFIRVRRLPDSQRTIGYRTHITDQPNPMISVMLGDFVHNLRSALDYIMVACVPRKRQSIASFPILLEDIWATDSEGNFMVNDTKRRENVEADINELFPKGRALVIKVQPYHQGFDRYRHILGIISRLENADKHRQLITVGGGVDNVRAVIYMRGYPVPWPDPLLGMGQFAKDDTILGYELPADRTDPEGKVVRVSEVDMEFTGTAKIFIKITQGGRNEPPSDFPLRMTMLMAIGEVRRLIRLMEPFVRR